MANIKPTAIHELKGSYKKDPQRRRTEEPRPPPLCREPPKSFSKMEREHWDELLNIVPANVLTNADRWVLEIAASLMTEFRTLKSDFPTSKLSHLHKCLSSLGLTPVDRTKVSVIADKEKDDWDSF